MMAAAVVFQQQCFSLLCARAQKAKCWSSLIRFYDHRLDSVFIVVALAPRGGMGNDAGPQHCSCSIWIEIECMAAATSSSGREKESEWIHCKIKSGYFINIIIIFSTRQMAGMLFFDDNLCIKSFFIGIRKWVQCVQGRMANRSVGLRLSARGWWWWGWELAETNGRRYVFVINPVRFPGVFYIADFPCKILLHFDYTINSNKQKNIRAKKKHCHNV